MQLFAKQPAATAFRGRQQAPVHHAAAARSRVVARAARDASCRAAAPAVAEPEVAAKEKAASYIQEFAVPAARKLLEPYAEPDQILVDLIALPDLDAALDPAAPSPDASIRDKAARLSRAVASAMDTAYGPDASTTTNGNGANGNGNGNGNGMANGGLFAASAAAFTVTDELRGPGAEQFQRRRREQQQQQGRELGFDQEAAHLFLQRVLYRVNRMAHFWYDDLKSYTNERSLFLASLRDAIESRWQRWEAAQLPDDIIERCRTVGLEEVKDLLTKGYYRDVDPAPSPALSYIWNDMGPLGYAHLLAIGSLDGLTEASRQSRVCAGAANPVACAVFRVLLEEYGNGRYPRKHSTFYKTMMEELGLDTREEVYLDLVPWQALANANSNFLLTERRRHYLRYMGGLSFFEINGPSVYKAYLGAGRRCGLSEKACGYWELHIREDERHGKQMLDEVAIPVADMYPNDAWEVLLGYEQEAFLGARAGAAVAAAIRSAEERAAAAGKA